jgi:hypothetical protein
MSFAPHKPIIYRPAGESRHTTPAEVCSGCSDFETGQLVPASFCKEAARRLPPPPWESQGASCRLCGSTERIPYDIKPPSSQKHAGSCTSECAITVLLCLNCRLAE